MCSGENFRQPSCEMAGSVACNTHLSGRSSSKRADRGRKRFYDSVTAAAMSHFLSLRSELLVSADQSVACDPLEGAHCFKKRMGNDESLICKGNPRLSAAPVEASAFTLRHSSCSNCSVPTGSCSAQHEAVSGKIVPSSTLLIRSGRDGPKDLYTAGKLD